MNIFTKILAGFLSIAAIAAPTNAGVLIGGADVQIGSNGSNEGIAEYSTWHNTVNGYDAPGHTVWDDEIDDGVDSDWVGVVITIDAIGNLYIQVGNNETAYGMVGEFNQINRVDAIASVDQFGEQAAIRDMDVYFFDTPYDVNPSEMVSTTSATMPNATTLISTPPLPCVKQKTFWAEGYGYQKVIITCSVRLQSLAQGLPNPESVYTSFRFFDN